MKEDFKYYISKDVKENIEDISIDYLENIKEYNKNTLKEFEGTNFK